MKLLTVRVNRVRRWHAPGALLIGDAAHAMSPIGGVGINLAVQDAVATARILGPKLAAGTLTDGDLDLVRRRRRFPTAVTQAASASPSAGSSIRCCARGARSARRRWYASSAERPCSRAFPPASSASAFRPEMPE